MLNTTTATRPVPFVDLAPQHDELREEIEAVFATILDTSAFVGGAHVQGFEAAFAEAVGVDHGVGVGSGTDAVRIALQAVGVGRDDAVVTVAHTFIATAEAITQAGALPLFIDVEPGTLTMDPAALREFLEDECRGGADGGLIHEATGRRLAAVLPVHLYGQPADMEPILALAAEAGVPVVEDAAQAHGARYQFRDGSSRACGALGDVAAFSFYPGKNLGAIGEAGAVVTNDPAVAERARILRDHGQSEKYIHITAEGSNARLDALQAAVLDLKLTRLDGWNERRRRVAARYTEGLKGAPVELPEEASYSHHVYHLYVIQVEERERLRQALGEAGVQTGLHYPVPLHRQAAYEGWPVVAGSLTETEAAAGRILSLPMYPHLDTSAVDHVVEQVLRLTR